jgi:nitrogen fixation-related uncharacterized protein
MEKMKITLSLLAVSSLTFATSINGQQYDDMMQAAHELKTFEKVYMAKNEVSPKVEEKIVEKKAEEKPQESAEASMPEVVEGSGVPDDECAAEKKPEAEH